MKVTMLDGRARRVGVLEMDPDGLRSGINMVGYTRNGTKATWVQVMIWLTRDPAGFWTATAKWKTRARLERAGLLTREH